MKWCHAREATDNIYVLSVQPCHALGRFHVAAVSNGLLLPAAIPLKCLERFMSEAITHSLFSTIALSSTVPHHTHCPPRPTTVSASTVSHMPVCPPPDMPMFPCVCPPSGSVWCLPPSRLTALWAGLCLPLSPRPPLLLSRRHAAATSILLPASPTPAAKGGGKLFLPFPICRGREGREEACKGPSLPSTVSQAWIRSMVMSWPCHVTATASTHTRTESMITTNINKGGRKRQLNGGKNAWCHRHIFVFVADATRLRWRACVRVCRRQGVCSRQLPCRQAKEAVPGAWPSQVVSESNGRHRIHMAQTTWRQACKAASSFSSFLPSSLPPFLPGLQKPPLLLRPSFSKAQKHTGIHTQCVTYTWI